LVFDYLNIYFEIKNRFLIYADGITAITVLLRFKVNQAHMQQVIRQNLCIGLLVIKINQQLLEVPQQANEASINTQERQ
jgi:hypothetical protein